MSKHIPPPGSSDRVNPESVGDSADLVELLYEELRGIADREYRRAGSPMTMQPTALVGEAYLRVRDRGDWSNRSHFLGCAATAMRHVLIDAARGRMRLKRKAQMESMTGALAVIADEAASDDQLIRLGDALAELARRDPQLAKLVDCRFFGGLDEEETASILGVTDRTVRRWWVRARAWIHQEMAEV